MNLDTPPVCNYEGSDYQQSFWEEGGRAYEDAAEAIALRRLLPKNGSRMLELGAGAGRNTHRYLGYDQIVLVDYSTTQLQQARARLGESNHYKFVAADIYHLPFVEGLFDGATMIRTLHHMADARAALDQVRSVLQSSAIFILEYANKRNLKSILRYTFRRQAWNPFSPEPIEFADLNFDFHPLTVRAWLGLSKFAIQRTLTVSHFRIGFLKRIVPLKLLVWMDQLLQLTGEWFQLSPSVFLRTKAIGDSPAAIDGQFFKCPSCGTPLQDTPPELICDHCGLHYPVNNGIYDFRLNAK
jgi:SAM-dependent methyltransferase